MTLAQRLRRLLHRPPTVEDCLRAAGMAPCEPLRAPENPHSHSEDWGSREDYATGGYMSPDRAPTVGEGSRFDVWPGEVFERCPVRCRQPVCPHVHRPVVNGPGLVERTKASHAAHIARYGDDTGFPVTEWGTFAENHLGHDAVEEG